MEPGKKASEEAAKKGKKTQINFGRFLEKYNRQIPKKAIKKGRSTRQKGASMLPKKIHYIWIGGNEKPELVKNCIESWKTYLPDYEIKEWNEQNFEIDCCKYAKHAYAEKKWAFVSDYMRFWILAREGGIYFDTDVELIRPIPAEILAQEAFTGMEFGGKVSPGLVFGCMPGDKTAVYMTERYESLEFDAVHPVTVNAILTSRLEKKGFRPEKGFQVVDKVAIYPEEYFCGYDLDVHEILTTEKTISIHHYSGSWTKKTLKKRVQALLKRILGVEGYRKVLFLKRGVKHVIFNRKG
ncbi:glycosyltransferase family 32 protein [Suipraeoptans intestinalis]|uniref:glycosyltransferase family 32 protein n=1 Tax=Suipraeoptans intestinalis TaxID=2606628 RepID=UPI002ED36D43